jgi:hypothetical protein
MCLSMRTEWLNRNLEPSRLCSSVEDFFEGRGFSTKETFSKGKHRIKASLADIDSVPFVVVEIYGDLSRIVVDFLPWGKKERAASTTLFSSILTLFGGGVLVRQDLKRKELMGEVEDQFWDFLDKQLLELAS